MKEYIKWIIGIIVLFWVFKSCVNGGGNNGKIDLTKTNTFVLQPYDGCSYQSMTVTLYGDGTDHVEGIYLNGESFKDNGRWELITGSYHDQEQKAITFEINYRYSNGGSRETGTIMPNFDFYEGPALNAADIALKKEMAAKGKMTIK